MSCRWGAINDDGFNHTKHTYCIIEFHGLSVNSWFTPYKLSQKHKTHTKLNKSSYMLQLTVSFYLVQHCGACAGLVAVTHVHLCTVLISSSWGHEVVPVSGWASQWFYIHMFVQPTLLHCSRDSSRVESSRVERTGKSLRVSRLLVESSRVVSR